MAGTQRLLAITMAIFSAGSSGSGNLDAMGVVVEANHASLGAHAAEEGTTIYDGDRVSTDAEGTVRLRIGEAMLDLRKQSSATVRESSRGTAKEFAVELASGVATLSIAAANDGEIVACEAHVRPVSQVRGVVRVQIIGPRELLVYAQRGPALVAYRGETETIAEGRAYRVLLKASEDDGQGGAIAKEPTRRGKLLVVVAIAAGAGVATGVALAVGGKQSAVESPDRP
jgi:hypothetical protein